MEKQKCDRCKVEEYIPTHQYVKFEDRVNYLCQACWDLFKGWYHHGTRARKFEDSNAA